MICDISFREADRDDIEAVNMSTKQTTSKLMGGR